MKSDRFTRMLLAIIAVALAALALRPHFEATTVQAQESGVHVFFEPGTTMITSPDKNSQFYGKVVVDLDNGKIWGFPTSTPAPYPVDSLNSAPPTSRPVYLGKFDFAAMKK